MIKKFVLLSIILSSSLLALSGFSDDHIKGKSTLKSLELHTCNYLPYKDHDDFMGVVDDWSAWMAENASVGYMGTVMQPVVMNEGFKHDMVWIGYAENNESMGLVNDEWLSKGGEVLALMQRVVECDAHLFGTMLDVRLDETALSAEDSFFMGIEACRFQDGMGEMDLIKYDNAFNSVMDELGLKANVSRMYPGAGWPDDMEAHFFNLAYFPSMAERGKIVDSLWSGKFDGLSGISEVISCGRQSVLAGTSVGGSSAQ